MEFIEVLARLRHYLTSHNIQPECVKLTLSGRASEIIALELAVQREVEDVSFFAGTANPPNIREFKMQGIEVELRLVEEAKGSYAYRDGLLSAPKW